MNEIALKLGYSSNVHKSKSAKLWLVVYGNKENHTLSLGRKNGVMMEEYTGATYCCTVRTGIILVRRNGKTVWCGNSIDAAHEGYSDLKGDMGNAPTYDKWNEMLSEVIRKLYRVTEAKGLLMLEIRERSEDNQPRPLWNMITNDALDAGFEYFGKFIEYPVPTFMLYTSGPGDARRPIPYHSEILIFRKGENGRLT